MGIRLFTLQVPELKRNCWVWFKFRSKSQAGMIQVGGYTGWFPFQHEQCLYEGGPYSMFPRLFCCWLYPDKGWQYAARSLSQDEATRNLTSIQLYIRWRYSSTPMKFLRCYGVTPMLLQCDRYVTCCYIGVLLNYYMHQEHLNCSRLSSDFRWRLSSSYWLGNPTNSSEAKTIDWLTGWVATTGGWMAMPFA